MNKFKANKKVKRKIMRIKHIQKKQIKLISHFDITYPIVQYNKITSENVAIALPNNQSRRFRYCLIVEYIFITQNMKVLKCEIC